jgi:CheY-like chemotaxis protein
MGVVTEIRRAAARLKTRERHNPILISANSSGVVSDEKGLIQLQASPTALHQSGNVDYADTHSSKVIRILVAEDLSDNRLLVRAHMEGSKHLLTFAYDGKAAVDLFATSDFDLVLMDIQMPVMDGLSATRAIREIERERDAAWIPIIALTANGSAQDIEMSRNAG